MRYRRLPLPIPSTARSTPSKTKFRYGAPTGLILQTITSNTSVVDETGFDSVQTLQSYLGPATSIVDPETKYVVPLHQYVNLRPDKVYLLKDPRYAPLRKTQLHHETPSPAFVENARAALFRHFSTNWVSLQERSVIEMETEGGHVNAKAQWEGIFDLTDGSGRVAFLEVRHHLTFIHIMNQGLRKTHAAAVLQVDPSKVIVYLAGFHWQDGREARAEVRRGGHGVLWVDGDCVVVEDPLGDPDSSDTSSARR